MQIINIFTYTIHPHFNIINTNFSKTHLSIQTNHNPNITNKIINNPNIHTTYPITPIKYPLPIFSHRPPQTHFPYPNIIHIPTPINMAQPSYYPIPRSQPPAKLRKHHKPTQFIPSKHIISTYIIDCFKSFNFSVIYPDTRRSLEFDVGCVGPLSEFHAETLRQHSNYFRVTKPGPNHPPPNFTANESIINDVIYLMSPIYFQIIFTGPRLQQPMIFYISNPGNFKGLNCTILPVIKEEIPKQHVIFAGSPISGKSMYINLSHPRISGVVPYSDAYLLNKEIPLLSNRCGCDMCFSNEDGSDKILDSNISVYTIDKYHGPSVAQREFNFYLNPEVVYETDIWTNYNLSPSDVKPYTKIITSEPLNINFSTKFGPNNQSTSTKSYIHNKDWHVCSVTEVETWNDPMLYFVLIGSDKIAHPVICERDEISNGEYYIKDRNIRYCLRILAGISLVGYSGPRIMRDIIDISEKTDEVTRFVNFKIKTMFDSEKSYEMASPCDLNGAGCDKFRDRTGNAWRNQYADMIYIIDDFENDTDLNNRWNRLLKKSNRGRSGHQILNNITIEKDGDTDMILYSTTVDCVRKDWVLIELATLGYGVMRMFVIVPGCYCFGLEAGKTFWCEKIRMDVTVTDYVDIDSEFGYYMNRELMDGWDGE